MMFVFCRKRPIEFARPRVISGFIWVRGGVSFGLEVGTYFAPCLRALNMISTGLALGAGQNGQMIAPWPQIWADSRPRTTNARERPSPTRPATLWQYLESGSEMAGWDGVEGFGDITLM